MGSVTFTQQVAGGNVTVTGTLTQVPYGVPHGFHIHQIGTIEPDCTAAGSHFNPTNVSHGSAYDSVRHIGDLGNVTVGSDQSVRIDLSFAPENLPLSGPNSIIGRTLVIHEKPDDGGHTGQADSSTTGNAGGRIGCGVIGLGTDFTVSSGVRLSVWHIPLLLTFLLLPLIR